MTTLSSGPTAATPAAAAAFVHWRRGDRKDWPALALIGVVTAVGIGSFVFHTVATRGAVLADVIHIAVFIYGYLLLALRRWLDSHARTPWAAAPLVAILVLTHPAHLPAAVLRAGR